MRVAFLAGPFLDPDHPASWSGLPYFMRRALNEAGVETITLHPEETDRPRRWARFLYWRLLRGKRYLRHCDARLLKDYARQYERQLAALAVDAIEPSGPVLRQRVEKRFAALHRDRATEGPLELRISMGFWSTEETKRFSEFLDSVEAGLRESPLISEEHLY